MIQFAISKGLNVRSTTFPHKDIHKETWYSADGRTANQIDHVLISNRFRRAITDRALRGPDIGSDHNLLKINFKVKLRVKTGNGHNEKRKMVNIFQNPKWKQEYAIVNPAHRKGKPSRMNCSPVTPWRTIFKVFETSVYHSLNNNLQVHNI